MNLEFKAFNLDIDFNLSFQNPNKGNSNDMDRARYVIKIEPKGNGPLFTEINYYQRNCKEADIDKFAKANKLKVLGIPKVFFVIIDS